MGYFKVAIKTLIKLMLVIGCVLIAQYFSSMIEVAFDGQGYIGFPAVFYTFQAYPDYKYFNISNFYVDVVFFLITYLYLLIRNLRKLHAIT